MNSNNMFSNPCREGFDSEETEEKFFSQEFQQCWVYHQHIESQMVTHLRFFVTLLLGLGSVAIAIFQLKGGSAFPTAAIVGGLFLAFWFVGQILRTVYVELRVRKMKAIEGINSIREYFNGKSSTISKYSVFPARRNESPPFLRKGSAEWYSIVFMAAMNSLSLMVFLLLTNQEWRWATYLITLGSHVDLPNQVQNLGWVLPILIGAGAFLWEFRFSTLHCYKYDVKRSKEVGRRSEYKLLDLQDRPILEECLVKLGEFFERCYDKKLISQEGRSSHENQNRKTSPRGS